MLKIFKRIAATAFLFMVLISPSMANETWARWLKFEKSFFKDELVLRCGGGILDFKLTKFLGVKNLYLLQEGKWVKKKAKFKNAYVSYSLGKRPFSLSDIENWGDSKTPSDITKDFLQYLPKDFKKKFNLGRPDYMLQTYFSEYFVLESPTFVKPVDTLMFNQSRFLQINTPSDERITFSLKSTAVGYIENGNNKRYTRTFAPNLHKFDCEVINY